VHAPVVLKVGATYFMYYDAFGSSGQYQIGVATSPDGVTFTDFVGNPILSPTLSWEGQFLVFPFVVYDLTEVNPAHRFKMMYSGSPDPNHFYHFGVAYSSDGLTWSKFAGNPVMGPSATGWDNGAVVSGTLHYDPSIPKWWLEYLGEDLNSPVSFGLPGLATAPAIEGPWTKSPNNPLIQARLSSTAVLTSSWTSGNTIKIGVDPSTIFAHNETCNMIDNQVSPSDPNATQLVRVIGMTNNGTCPSANCGTITLDASGPHGDGGGARTFLVGNNAQIISVYSRNFDPGQVYQDPATGVVRMLCQGSWYTIAAKGFVGIREYGAFMIANTPTPGPTPTGSPPSIWDTTSWSFDFDAGVFQYPNTAQPNGLTSNENPQFLINVSITPLPTPTTTPSRTPVVTPTFTQTPCPTCANGGQGGPSCRGGIACCPTATSTATP